MKKVLLDTCNKTVESCMNREMDACIGSSLGPLLTIVIMRDLEKRLSNFWLMTIQSGFTQDM